jgi:hypothetical protein
VGRIVSLKDADLQYSYALSTVNGMAHLKDAIAQYVAKYPKSRMRNDLLTVHEKVIRAMKHLVKDFNVNLNTIRAFNTKHVLSSLEYLKEGGAKHHRKTMRKRR